MQLFTHTVSGEQASAKHNNWFKSFASLTQDVRKLRSRPPLNQTLGSKSNQGK